MPLLTTKKVFFRGAFEELMWFLRGDTNAKHLSEKGVSIWDGNTSREFLDSVGLQKYEEGDIGAMYYFQIYHFNEPYQGMNHTHTGGFNQFEYCINLIKTDPYSRRIMMTTYNPLQSGDGVLFPCHSVLIQFNVDGAHNLNCLMVQRSADSFLGLPFNICSTSLLVRLIVEVINNDSTYLGRKLSAGKLTIQLGDTHLYEDHYSQAIRQILREPFAFPVMKINRTVSDITDFKFEDIELVGYSSYPNIVAKMVV